jgi:ABC-type glutathione transport system ATPase component
LNRLKKHERFVVGIAGVPGAGKSWLARHLAASVNQRLNEEVAILAPMDGFHLTKAQLAKMEVSICDATLLKRMLIHLAIRIQNWRLSDVVPIGRLMNRDLLIQHYSLKILLSLRHKRLLAGLILIMLWATQYRMASVFYQGT